MTPAASEATQVHGLAYLPTPVDLDRLFREESGRILASLIALVGDFDRAEEAMQEAFTVAAERWPREGVPATPRAWIVGTARHKALDRLRRERIFAGKAALLKDEEAVNAPDPDGAPEGLPDDRLRLVFTCSHPALALEARVALTLHTLGGLSTPEIARAFLVPESTLAQRLVRAKRKIRDAGIPYRVPGRAELPERLDGVLATLYLIFNEGYAATGGNALVRRDLSAEAIRLARLVVELLPGERDARGLLALMLLTDARREARVDGRGDLVLLEEQDRRLWDRAAIAEGMALLPGALSGSPPGPYAVEAAIAALHARAASPSETDWRQIAALYGTLHRVRPSPVVALNRAVAVAMSAGPEAGLPLVEELERSGALAGYHLLPAAKADLLRRLGRHAEAAESYRAALALAGNGSERRFLSRRLEEEEVAFSAPLAAP
ncbi:MAG: RNA polymerase sigma factor [Acidobacteria bacterium]|nr:RNA polymerase sigma factor [Acidobacteriota bacterium]